MNRIKPVYTNCFFWAMWQWVTKGGYLVIRKARAGWFWHFLWKPTESAPMQHFRSHAPIRFPWPIQRGYITVTDGEDND